jgi:hypothetical protein
VIEQFKVELLIRIDFTLPTILFSYFGRYSPLFKIHIELRLPHHENRRQHFLNIHFEYLTFDDNQSGPAQQATPTTFDEALVATDEVEQ